MALGGWNRGRTRQGVMREDGGEGPLRAPACATKRRASCESSVRRNGPQGCPDGRGRGREENTRRAGRGSLRGRGRRAETGWTGSRGRVGLGGVEDRCLIEEPGEEIALRWSAGGREGRELVETSRWRRMAETKGGSARNARILTSLPQGGQSSGSTS